ncbi:hypothetical protein M5689_011550 [Euphorbia peplus]|nr:hypothetical protein M5689_011550 [Euphorbia peplus]
MKKIERMIVIVMFIGILVPSVLSQVSPIPGTQCWSGLLGIPGCLTLSGTRVSVKSGESTLASGIFSHECCIAAEKLSEECWVNMFPVFPFIGQLLKNFCSGLLPSPPAA